jgi:hypothetical protein
MMMSKSRRSGLPALLVGVLCAALLAGALLAASASAAFEQVGCFAGTCSKVINEEFPEETQLSGVGGLAVNVAGAGGVPAGTVYAASWFSGKTKVAMYEPRPDGRLEFVEAWQLEYPGPYEVCGPAAKTLPDGSPPGEHAACPPRPGPAGGGNVDVAVDQASGNVFVFAEFETFAGGEAEIVEYTPSGGSEVTRFGLQAPPSKDTAESPTEVHQVPPFMGPLTVGGGGTVYLADEYRSSTETSKNYSRVMVFEQETPGDYAHYEYAGEVAAGFQVSHGLDQGPAVDDTGNLYLVNNEKEIEEYAPASPAAYPAPSGAPLCSFPYEPGGITAMTVEPVLGEVFFYSYKPPKRLRRLGTCNPGTGKFGSGAVEEALAVGPERNYLTALAVDPTNKYSPGRPAGILYGAAPQYGADASQSALGYIFARAEENPPTVSAQAVAHVTAISAVLRARVDRKGFNTAYRFQYETAAQFEANPPGERFAGAGEAPGGEAVLEEGSGPQNVAVALAGLQAETEYRYRAVTVSHCAPPEPSKTCETDGAGAAFRTYPPGSGALPDARAYELVSPARKNGGQVLPAEPRLYSCPVECKPGITFFHFPMLSAPDGDAAAYEGTPFSEGGAAIENLYLAHRSPSSWQSADPSPPLLTGTGYTGLSSGFERAVLSQSHHAPPLAPGAPAGYEDLYTQLSADPLTLTPLLTANPPVRQISEFQVTYAGASADGQRIFFKANDALTAADPGVAPAAPPVGVAESDLYEWSGGVLHLVNVLPGNAAAAPGAFAGLGSAHGISVKGDRAFWASAAGALYVREGGEVTKPIPGSGPGAGLAVAAADGGRALLANGSLYDLEEEISTDLTQGKGGFLGILGAGVDLESVYFVDTAVLPSAVGEENCRAVYVGGGEVCEEAQAGKVNLYAYSEGAPTRFVATLLAADNNNTVGFGASDWAPAPAERTAEASPGGRYLTFLSHAQLTGYENTGPCESDHAGGFVPAPCVEAFAYDSQTGELRCASCNRSGAPPLGWSVLRRIAPAGASLPQARYLTDSGRLYFDSQDSLSPADTNEGAEDVYQWEPQGTGGCGAAEGCLSLLSAGREAGDSNLLGVNEGSGGAAGGADVFFTTRDRLVGADTDALIDLYDAREPHVPGEVVGFGESLAPHPCSGEGCQAPGAGPAQAPAPSESTVGPGNYTPSKKRGCPKGKVKRGGRCVAKRHTHKPKRHNKRVNHKRKEAGR